LDHLENISVFFFAICLQVHAIGISLSIGQGRRAARADSSVSLLGFVMAALRVKEGLSHVLLLAKWVSSTVLFPALA
jgi:hypothetical protein